jgi:hypothetical protein
MRNQGLKWLLILSFVFFVSCNKENNNYKSTGTITGPDVRMCACCGGWLITIDNTQYQFNSLPGNSSIHLDNEKFPIPVRLDWTLNTTGCPNTISIQRIQKE